LILGSSAGVNVREAKIFEQPAADGIGTGAEFDGNTSENLVPKQEE
jgi:hypothetical protein